MKASYFFNVWGNIPHAYKLIIGAVLVTTIFTAILWIRLKWRKLKVETFLFNNHYHSINPRTNEIIFPQVIFKKDKIILRKCMRKTVEQIYQEKAIWEQTFNREIGFKRIAGIESEGNKITMGLI